MSNSEIILETKLRQHHWLELITKILSFLQISRVRKTTTQLFKYFRRSRKLTKNSSLHVLCLYKQIKDNSFYLHCKLLPDYNNCFCLVYTIYPYLYPLFSHLFLFSIFSYSCQMLQYICSSKLFLPSYQLTSFLVFDQGTDQKGFFSYHILIRILSMNCSCDKNFLIIFHRSLYCKDMAELCSVNSFQKQVFAEVLQNSCY